ncbi:MAG: hypothetical protein BroJett021_33340 [Chloroflexota bacterium]|jgi:hypothetical protein|nr:MAG: hypothetical protein BroJett021_33340 [Chloroflexota bacterium]
MAAQNKIKNRPVEMRFITRMDYERTAGWWVRISSAGRPIANKLFSDSKFGGKQKALSAAKKWRDRQLDAHRGILALAVNKHRIHTSDRRSLSGITGVSPEIEKRSLPYSIKAWKAAWPADYGIQMYARFSVVVYGYQGAFNKAVERRYAEIGKPVPRKRVPASKPILEAIEARD